VANASCVDRVQFSPAHHVQPVMIRAALLQCRD